MRASLRLLVISCVLLFVSGHARSEEEAQFRSAPLASGSRFETTVYEQDTGRAGPTVLIVSGLHGDEPASSYAADQVRHWPLVKGRLVVVPRANVPALRAGARRTPDEARGLSDANRNFPRTGEERGTPPRGELATALWELVQRVEPDWLLDLHEGFDVHRRNPQSVGRSVIALRDEEADRVVGAMIAAVDATIADPTLRYTRLVRPIDGSLARAAAVHLDVRAMIVETSRKGLARSTRAREHRVLVHRFLRELGMLADDIDPGDVGHLDGRRARAVVGVYDGGGAAGRGVPELLRALPRLEDVAVARIGPTEIRAGALSRFDVVVFSGGTGSGQSRYLQEDGRAAVRSFVESGGGYVGICAGSYLAASGYSWGLGILDARPRSPQWRRGTAVVRMGIADAGRTLLDTHEETVRVLYANGPILEPDDDPDVPDFDTLAVFRTEVAKNGSPAGLMIDTPAILRGRFGTGRVVCFSPHPEQTDGLRHMVPAVVEWMLTGDDPAPRSR